MINFYVVEITSKYSGKRIYADHQGLDNAHIFVAMSREEARNIRNMAFYNDPSCDPVIIHLNYVQRVVV